MNDIYDSTAQASNIVIPELIKRGFQLVTIDELFEYREAIHSEYGEYRCLVSIEEIEMISGDMPNKQLKMVCDWAALLQEELREVWYLAQQQKELFPIDPIK